MNKTNSQNAIRGDILHLFSVSNWNIPIIYINKNLTLWKGPFCPTFIHKFIKLLILLYLWNLACRTVWASRPQDNHLYLYWQFSPSILPLNLAPFPQDFHSWCPDYSVLTMYPCVCRSFVIDEYTQLLFISPGLTVLCSWAEESLKEGKRGKEVILSKPLRPDPGASCFGG